MRCALLGMLAALMGCSSGDNAQTMLDDYVWRVSNVLDTQTPSTQRPRAISVPRIRERRLATSEFKIDLLDFLSMQGCDLGYLLGYRNSSLGLVMPTSQRLVYEVNFVRIAQQCLPELEQSDSTFATELKDILRQKRNELPRHIWNAIFAGPEFAELMSTSTTLAETGAEDASDAALQAILEIESLTMALLPNESELLLDDKKLESALAIIHRNPATGRALLRFQALTSSLDATRSMLERAIADKRLCPMGKTTPRGQYLRNVFDLYYAGKVQPYVVLAYRTDRELLEALNRIRRALDVEISAPMQRYWAQTLSLGAGSLFGDLDSALNRHTLAWQQALGACQLMPGSNIQQ